MLPGRQQANCQTGSCFLACFCKRGSIAGRVDVLGVSQSYFSSSCALATKVEFLLHGLGYYIVLAAPLPQEATGSSRLPPAPDFASSPLFPGQHENLALLVVVARDEQPGAGPVPLPNVSIYHLEGFVRLPTETPAMRQHELLCRPAVVQEPGSLAQMTSV